MSSISSTPGIPDSRRRQGKCCSYFVPLMGFCNTIGLVGMGMLVSFLFVQLQYVSYRLNAEQKDLAQLKLQVQNQTEGQIQELVTQVEQQKDYTVYQLAGTFTLLTCLLTTFHMVSHLRKLNEPFIQRKILVRRYSTAAIFGSPTSFFVLYAGSLAPISHTAHLNIFQRLFYGWVQSTHWLVFAVCCFPFRKDTCLFSRISTKPSKSLPTVLWILLLRDENRLSAWFWPLFLLCFRKCYLHISQFFDSRIGARQSRARGWITGKTCQPPSRSGSFSSQILWSTARSVRRS